MSRSHTSPERLSSIMSKDSSRPSKTPAGPAESSKKPEGTGKGTVQPARATDPVEAARYIEAFALELSSLAKRSRLDFLAYLLDMARIEAERISGRGTKD